MWICYFLGVGFGSYEHKNNIVMLLYARDYGQRSYTYVGRRRGRREKRGGGGEGGGGEGGEKEEREEGEKKRGTGLVKQSAMLRIPLRHF